MDLPSFGFRAPAPPLRHLVSAYYWLHARGGEANELLHPEWTNVRLDIAAAWRWGLVGDPAEVLTGARIFGPTNRAARIHGTPGGLVLGFGLLPQGLAQLVGVPASGLANGHAPLDLFWPVDVVAALVARLRASTDPDHWAAVIDEILLERLVNAPKPHWLLRAGHEALAGGDIDTVEEFAHGLGINVRMLERLSGPLFGFGPKTLLRRQRFLRTLAAVELAPAGEVIAASLGLGFVDQSHFVREFRAFMGMTPTAYLALPRTVMRQAVRERTRLLGDAMQVLQRPGRGA
jgi:AraC-like DNA-binding protein